MSESENKNLLKPIEKHSTAKKPATRSMSANSKSSSKKKSPVKKMQSKLGNFLDSDLMDDVRAGTRQAMNKAGEGVKKVTKENANNMELAKNLVNNLTSNVNRTFEHNFHLGQESLRCKTASDVVDLQRKFFDYNFKNNLKIYTDFVQDIQQITNDNFRNVATNAYLLKQ